MFQGPVSIERLRQCLRLRQRQNTYGFCTHFCGSGSVTIEVNGDQIFSGNAPTNANAQWKRTLNSDPGNSLDFLFGAGNNEADPPGLIFV